jgi:hypothetical protein
MAVAEARKKHAGGRPRDPVRPKDKYYHYLLRLPHELASQITEQATSDDRDFRHHLMRLIKIGLDAYQPSSYSDKRQSS